MAFDCPDCGDVLRATAKRCKCGWKSAEARSESATKTADRDHQRCAWECNGERCRYVGTWSNSTVGGGPFYCRGHSVCTNGALGQRIVTESRDAFSAGFDYTPANLQRVAREAPLRLPPRPENGVRLRGNVITKHIRAPDYEALVERMAIEAEG